VTELVSDDPEKNKSYDKQEGREEKSEYCTNHVFFYCYLLVRVTCSLEGQPCKSDRAKQVPGRRAYNTPGSPYCCCPWFINLTATDDIMPWFRVSSISESQADPNTHGHNHPLPDLKENGFRALRCLTPEVIREIETIVGPWSNLTSIMKTLKRHFPKNHFISEQVLYRIRSCHEGRQLGYNCVQFKVCYNTPPTATSIHSNVMWAIQGIYTLNAPQINRSLSLSHSTTHHPHYSSLF
jgi:hypothetical protein